jgi:hypothetical protein
MTSTWSIVVDAFPVLAMAAAIMLIPLVSDHETLTQVEKKQTSADESSNPSRPWPVRIR